MRTLPRSKVSDMAIFCEWLNYMLPSLSNRLEVGSKVLCCGISFGGRKGGRGMAFGAELRWLIHQKLSFSTHANRIGSAPMNLEFGPNNSNL